MVRRVNPLDIAWNKKTHEHNRNASSGAYLRFLQECDIGLCTQDPNAKFNDTSFPSKILSYFSNGLQVVSVRTKAIESSSLSDIIYYCDDNKPENVADAIKAVNIESKIDTLSILHKLDVDFKKDIRVI